MNPESIESAQPISPSPEASSNALALRKRLRSLAAFCAVVTLAFGWELYAMVRLGLEQSLYSHLPLIPLVSAYLLWLRKGSLPRVAETSPGLAIALLVSAVAVLASWYLRRTPDQVLEDRLAATILAFLLFLLAGAAWFLGARWFKAAAFPIGFLIFMIPMPVGLVQLLEQGSQHASAEAADVMLAVWGETYVRTGLVFELVGIKLMVAEECSGIRSSVVLFITGVFAANLLLRTAWRRFFLAAIVIPLGIIRNGFRVFVIAELCVHQGPHMVDSPIHHQGGPVFFALSLIPLLLIVWWLRRDEARWARR